MSCRVSYWKQNETKHVQTSLSQVISERCKELSVFHFKNVNNFDYDCFCESTETGSFKINNEST